MEDHLIRVNLKGAIGTPWQSDTLFGHLCWQVAYGQCDLSIDEFLTPFREGKPPFVFSDGFPAGYLPRPETNVFDGAEDMNLESYRSSKRWKKVQYVTGDDFQRMRRGEKPVDGPLFEPWRSHLQAHATLDRNTLTTAAEGGLYEVLATSPTGRPQIDIYLRTQPDWFDRVCELLHSLAQVGYGRDKSVGTGAFTIDSITSSKDFGPLDGANGFISLSSMTPAQADPTDALFTLRIKHGKLGEGLGANPFKKPLFQMEPGATFKTDLAQTNKSIKPFYGRLVTGLAPGAPQIVQNCFTIAVPTIIAPAGR